MPWGIVSLTKGKRSLGTIAVITRNDIAQSGNGSYSGDSESDEPSASSSDSLSSDTVGSLASINEIDIMVSRSRLS